MSLETSCCFPRTLLGTFGGAGFAFGLAAATRFFFACQVFAHRFKCSCHVILLVTPLFSCRSLTVDCADSPQTISDGKPLFVPTPFLFVAHALTLCELPVQPRASRFSARGSLRGQVQPSPS